MNHVTLQMLVCLFFKKKVSISYNYNYKSLKYN